MGTACAARILALLIAVGEPAPGSADPQAVTVGAGVSFDLPPGLVPLSDVPPPVAMSWRSTTDPVSVYVAVIPEAGSTAPAVARELQDWPGAGRSMASGYGTSLAKSLGQSLAAPCAYTGVPLARHSELVAVHVQADITCQTAPQSTSVHSLALLVWTRSSQVSVRVDAAGAGSAAADSIASAIWRSLRVAPEQRLVASWTTTTTEAKGRHRPVTGGAGIHVRDYGLVRSGTLVGEFLGAIVADVLLGALLAIVFIRLGLGPLASVIASQALLLLGMTWGRAHDGSLEIDWLIRGIPPVVAAGILYRWARRRWERRQLLRMGAGPQ